MGNPLQDHCSAAELASVKQVIEITGRIDTFNGFASIIEADLAALDADKIPSGWRDSAVTGELQFGFADVAGCIPMLTGSATAAVGAVCQRCLEPFQLMLGVEPKLLLLEAEQVVDGYDDFEVWELEEQKMRPQDIVEELLIMAMPLSAMHNNMADCGAFSSDDEGVEKLVKPFAALRSQMTQNETNLD